MPTLLRRPWTSKPPFGTPLNRNHSLCPDVFCLPLNEGYRVQNQAGGTEGGKMRDLIGGRFGSCTHVNVNTGWEANANGIVHTQLVDNVGFGADTFLPTTQITVILGYVKRDATLRTSGAVGSTAFNPGGGQSFDTLISWTDGNTYWDFGGITSGTSRLLITTPTLGSSDIWAFTSGSRGMEIWLNGVLKGSQAGHTTFVTGGGNFSLGGAATQSADWADYKFVYVYSTQLLQSQIKDISSNPWQIFVPPPTLPKFAIPVAAGTGQPCFFVMT